MNRLKEQHLFIHISQTDSTNKYLQLFSENETTPSGSIVLADYQTAGRGQIHNSWESEAEQNLTFSIYFCPENVPANMPFVISEMVSLSIKYTLDKYIADISIKWPNDIYYKDNKIAGILIENTISDIFIEKSIIGIGLNINQTKFISNAPNPVSMALATGHSFERLIIINEFHEIFSQQSERLNNSCFNSIHNEYIKSLYRKEGYHKYADIDGIFEASIYDIEPTGQLVLERSNGTLSKYTFKEVIFC